MKFLALLFAHVFVSLVACMPLLSFDKLTAIVVGSKYKLLVDLKHTAINPKNLQLIIADEDDQARSAPVENAQIERIKDSTNYIVRFTVTEDDLKSIRYRPDATPIYGVVADPYGYDDDHRVPDRIAFLIVEEFPGHFSEKLFENDNLSVFRNGVAQPRVANRSRGNRVSSSDRLTQTCQDAYDLTCYEMLGEEDDSMPPRPGTSTSSAYQDYDDLLCHEVTTDEEYEMLARLPRGNTLSIFNRDELAQFIKEADMTIDKLQSMEDGEGPLSRQSSGTGSSPNLSRASSSSAPSTIDDFVLEDVDMTLEDKENMITNHDDSFTFPIVNPHLKRKASQAANQDFTFPIVNPHLRRMDSSNVVNANRGRPPKPRRTQKPMNPQI